MGETDDKLFRKYSEGKNFSSFINDFDRATNEKDKEKVVKELKNINSLVEHYIEMDENSKYESKLFDVNNAIDFFCMGTLNNEGVILIEENTQKL